MIYAMRGPRMEALSAPRAKGCGRVIETVTPGPPQIRIGIPHCRTLPPGARATSGPLHARPHPAVGLIPQPRRRAGTVTVAILSRTLPVALHDAWSQGAIAYRISSATNTQHLGACRSQGSRFFVAGPHHAHRKR